MKIKLPNDLLSIDISITMLILSVSFIPDTAARIVLGLPFLLFFPGYVLVEALFPQRKRSAARNQLSANKIPLNPPFKKGETSSSESPPDKVKGIADERNVLLFASLPPGERGLRGSEEMGGIERTALSLGLSIACIAIIGLGLNYTPWGISLEPLLYSISAFIIVLSGVAWIRRRHYGCKNLMTEISFKLPSFWSGSVMNKALSVILIAAILGTMGTLVYVFVHPKSGEKFTEFYILGINGKATGYPAKFALNSRSVVKWVQYGTDTTDSVLAVESCGRITLGVVNYEQQLTSYTVKMTIDNQDVDIISLQQSAVSGQPEIGPIKLQPEEKWEQVIGIVPQHAGENQKVDLLLYKDDGIEPYLDLHLWIDVSIQ